MGYKTKGEYKSFKDGIACFEEKCWTQLLTKLFKAVYAVSLNALKTQKRWVEKNVNLNLLSENIESFFDGKEFETKKDKLAEGYKISIVPQHVRNMKDDINIKILGHSDDFMVEFSTGELSSSSTMLGLSTVMFGGGIFVLRGLRLRKTLERLEKEFWVYVEETIADMVSC